MVVWRLTRKKYANDLSGEGARIHGGRWNYKGMPVLYTSSHCSLALLELLANTSKELLPDDLYYLKIFIPNNFEISTVSAEALPDNWKSYPAPFQLADIVSRAFNEKQVPILSVPSVLVPFERNILLNPLNPLAQEIITVEQDAFTVDFRLEK